MLDVYSYTVSNNGVARPSEGEKEGREKEKPMHSLLYHCCFLVLFVEVFFIVFAACCLHLSTCLL